MGAAKSAGIYQFKVTMTHITPPIWRRVQVEGGCTLAHLHCVLQSAMGWENYHLYMFRIGKKTYGPSDPRTMLVGTRSMRSGRVFLPSWRAWVPR